jgi:hypothetical protein
MEKVVILFKLVLISLNLSPIEFATVEVKIASLLFSTTIS